MDRDKIIEYLKDFSVMKQYVNAMWLEGADGIGRVDEYSDIDVWFDVDKSRQESFLYECIAKLEELAGIDSRVDEIRPEIAQSNVHLEQTSEYLTIDICVQSHEIRGKAATCYAKGDIAELPFVLFDKRNIISYFEYNINRDEISHVLAQNQNRIRQTGRVTKYIKRGQYLEAYMKYMENVVIPLVKTARLLYTPRHFDYGLCHISDHLPAEIVRELEPFYQVTGLKEIEEQLNRAESLFVKYKNCVMETYHLT